MNTSAAMALPEITIDPQGNEYCLIPAGVFLAGEKNVEQDLSASFYLARYPVTRASFVRFVEETNYQYGQIHMKAMDHISPSPDCPASPISWWDAKYYVRWLRHITGEYYSLPTELEWEKAARGVDGRLFPWGNDLPTETEACFSSDFKRVTTDEVGSHPAGDSPYGCADMAGNVWEWTLDDLDEYGEVHAVRGGSCRNKMDACTCLSRAFVTPSTLRLNYTGFRLLYLPGDLWDRYAEAIAAKP